ncbi:hypothetical protein BpHYR1_015114 [Brachionus plicatilis]|uniref:Uncharacterized protein n=1 Tax=Brachionus plicatilis TaxID=10195 RepID=A0A3M7SAG2_BRAPC|nr:hypothetical protein BpHYR1_015114 [Brachionus plicatilis]
MAFTSGGSLIGLSLVLTDLVAFDSAISILQLNLATSLLRPDYEFIEGCVTWVSSAKELLNVSQFVICVVCTDSYAASVWIRSVIAYEIVVL